MSKLWPSVMRYYFSKRSSDATLQTLSKLYDVPVGFVPPPLIFKAMYCFMCGRRRMTVARYRMICLLVKGPPQPPVDVEVDCAEPEQAKVSWRPQFQGGSSQTFFVQAKVNESWITLERHILDDRQGGRIFHVIDKLGTKWQYEFRIGSVNNDTIEVFSDTSKCTSLGM